MTFVYLQQLCELLSIIDGKNDAFTEEEQKAAKEYADYLKDVDYRTVEENIDAVIDVKKGYRPLIEKIAKRALYEYSMREPITFFTLDILKILCPTEGWNRMRLETVAIVCDEPVFGLYEIKE